MVGVILPFYKIEFFKECLQSLAQQTDKDFTVYIGNDASPNDPLPIIQEFQDDLHIVYKKFKRNLGSESLVRQWDRCIAMSEKEDWIMVLGDDDYLSPNVIQTFSEHLGDFQEKSNVVRFATISVNDSDQPVSGKYEHPIWETGADSYYRRFRQITRSSLSEYIFKRSAYVKYGFHDFPLGWYSDNRAWLEFSEQKKIYTINEAVVYVRISELSISGRSDNEDLKAKAELEFYEYLIKRKLILFKEEESLKLLRFYEDRLRERDKLSVSKFFKFFFLYFTRYRKEEFKKFIQRTVL